MLALKGVNAEVSIGPVVKSWVRIDYSTMLKLTNASPCLQGTKLEGVLAVKGVNAEVSIVKFVQLLGFDFSQWLRRRTPPSYVTLCSIGIE